MSPGAFSEVKSIEDLELVSGEDELVLEESWTRTIPTVFCWDQGGQEVFLAGSFSEWNVRIPMISRYMLKCLMPKYVLC